MTPLVSILIPAYNAEKFIAESISSAIGQDWPAKEIIIVDDGSTDRTAQIARDFESRGVKVLTQENQGAQVARNTAYAACQGEFIQWLDADDFLASDKISRQMAVVRQGVSSRTLLSGEWGVFAYRRTHAKFLPNPLWEDLEPLEWMLRSMEHNAWMQTGAWLISRELSEAAGPWDTRLSVNQDGEYIFRVVPICDQVEFVPGARIFYRRVVGESVSNRISGSRKKAESLYLSIQLHVDTLMRIDESDRARDAVLRYLEALAIFFYPEWPDLFSGLQEIAVEAGGELPPPSLPRKYSWAEKSLGIARAKKAMIFLRGLRARMEVGWDHFLAQIGNDEKQLEDV